MSLTPCEACGRHVKDRDCRCPFCGAKVACAPATASGRIDRVARSSLLAASALGTALAVTDCGSSPSVLPPYGAAPAPPPAESGSSDGGTEASSASDAGDGRAARIDASETASEAGDAADAGDAGDAGPRILPPYGAPPPP